MIIRKPYAFLIKNFKKIHIVMLILSLFVAYKLIDTNNFVNNFMRLGIYDLYADPVTRHITTLMMISIIVLIAGCAALIFLLLHKNKPWKAYLIPLIVYISLFFILTIIKSFFKTYTMDVETTDLRFSRDVLMMFVVGQLPAIAIFVIRTFGLDIGKFNFNMDEEFLELSEEDREEIEVSIDVDVNTFKRLYRKTLRNLEYFYKEHTLITRVIVGLIVVIFIFNIYTFVFIKNRVYKEGSNYNYNGFTVNVNNSYFTDKSYNGEVISDTSNFVILDMSIKNNSDEARNFNISNFHLKAGTKDFVTTETTYSKEFSDLGNTYSNVKKIGKQSSLNYIVVYKVDRDIDKSRFVLFFQEKGGDSKLRKIKLNVKDLSKLEKQKVIKSGDDLKIDIYGVDEDVSFYNASLSKSIIYGTRRAMNSTYYNEDVEYVAPEGYKVLSIEFGSESLESKNMIDILNKYGKIDYRDSSNKDREMDVDLAVKSRYLGKYVYLKVPDNFDSVTDVSIAFTIRNKQYKYMLY